MRISSVVSGLFMLLVMQGAVADDLISAQSPEHCVALLELYTSQGCSSCPPAESWLSSLNDSGFSSRQIIPLAFHVTYWDYIGWRDRFASVRYDERQRRIAAFNAQRTIYTPQFVLGGDDYRSYGSIASDIRDVISKQSLLGLNLSAQKKMQHELDILLSASTGSDSLNEVALYLVVYENDLQSQVDEGENKGELLHHDYVVRQLYGPFTHQFASGRTSLQQVVTIDGSWKKHDLNLAAFAQHVQTGEVLQAVHLELGNLD